MRRTVVISSIVIITVTLFLTFYPFPHAIHIKQPVVQFIENDPDSASTTTMRIDGYLYKPFQRASTFKGHITFDSFVSTKQDKNLAIVITEHHDGINLGNLTYQSQVSPFHLTNQGLIWFDDDLEHINIWASSAWTAKEDQRHSLFIVGTANYLPEALSIQSDMRTRFKGTFLPK